MSAYLLIAATNTNELLEMFILLLLFSQAYSQTAFGAWLLNGSLIDLSGQDNNLTLDKGGPVAYEILAGDSECLVIYPDTGYKATHISAYDSIALMNFLYYFKTDVNLTSEMIESLAFGSEMYTKFNASHVLVHVGGHDCYLPHTADPTLGYFSVFINGTSGDVILASEAALPNCTYDPFYVTTYDDDVFVGRRSTGNNSIEYCMAYVVTLGLYGAPAPHTEAPSTPSSPPVESISRVVLALSIVGSVVGLMVFIWLIYICASKPEFEQVEE